MTNTTTQLNHSILYKSQQIIYKSPELPLTVQYMCALHAPEYFDVDYDRQEFFDETSYRIKQDSMAASGYRMVASLMNVEGDIQDVETRLIEERGLRHGPQFCVIVYGQNLSIYCKD